MATRELVAILEQLGRLYAAGGAKTAEKDLAKVIECLTPHVNEPLEAFAAKLRSASALPGPGKRKELAIADEAIVDQCVTRLTEAGIDQNTFEQAFALVSKDARIRLKEADAIARKFTRQATAFKTKKAALLAIKQAFVERARFENKLKVVS